MIEAKLAFLTSGGTGSGKTTLLATLLALMPQQEPRPPVVWRQ